MAKKTKDDDFVPFMFALAVLIILVALVRDAISKLL
jgi:hypothetical protein